MVILADILWYTSSRKNSSSNTAPADSFVIDSDILSSVDRTLSQKGEVWIASGKYTTCAQDFFKMAGEGWTWAPVSLGDQWEMPEILGVANLDERKQNCLCWRMTRQNSTQA